MHRSAKILRSLVSLVCTSLLFNACQMTQAAAESKEQPIKIGFIAPLTGVGAVPGHHMKETAELYLDTINHRIAGHPVELVIENDESSPAAGKMKFLKLAQQDKVSVIGGSYFSHVTYAIAPLAEQLKVPLVVCVAGADDITKRKRSRWVLRSGWCSSLATLPFGEYAAKDLHSKRVVTLAMDYPYGYEVVGDFQKSFEDSGGQIVQKLWAPLGFSDFSQTISQIRKDADAIFLCTVGPACKTIPRQIKEAHINIPLIGIGTSFDETFFPEVGDAMVGAVSALPYALLVDTPANRAFLKAFRGRFNSDPSWEAMLAWTQMMFLQKAIETAKGNVDDREKFLAVLRSTQLDDSPHGPLKLDSFGNPVENVYIRKVTREGGSLQNTVIKTIKMASQFGKYDPDEFMKEPEWTKTFPPCKYCQPAP